MSIVKSGDTVKVHYTGKLDNGDVFDSSDGAEPLAFIVGAGEVIHGFDQALMGMKVGETKDVVIEREQAYGNRMEDLVQTIHRRQCNLGGAEPEVGMHIEMRTPDGNIPLTITDITDKTITLDANHLLAGETLHFSLTLIEITA